MSGIHRTKIEWADSTWNPVTGCLHDCPYCYAVKQASRFKPQAGEWPEQDIVHAADHDPRCFIATKPVALTDADGKYLRTTPYPKGFAPTLHSHKLEHLKSAKEPRRIFVGSMADLFGEWVPDEWLEEIFRLCSDNLQHVYMFLTKNPARYLALGRAGNLPEGDNFWYGTTATTGETDFFFSDRHNTYISIEPMLGEFVGLQNPLFPPGWVIVGPMNGPGARKHAPRREWVETLVAECVNRNIPLFMKKELVGVWDKPLSKEFPAAQLDHIKKAKEARGGKR